MDDRFPKWLRTIVRKLDFLGVPNLGPLVAAMMVLAAIAKMTGAPYERFLFDPEMVLQGEWWRLFAFPIPQTLDPLFLILFVAYSYFIITSIEGLWGPGPTTVFILLTYLASIGAAFITGMPVQIWFYILQNLGLAFGTLFPDFEILLFFILPVKAKWIAAFTGALIAYQFLTGGAETKILLAVTLIPYFLFFGPMVVKHVQTRSRIAKNRKRFDDDMWR
jgi:hypothetical protein